MQLGWIDFSRQDKADSINIINSMKEKGVLDELGFGALRQAFANCFFPGTSTIQTRAKYFFIVSYILQDFISSVSASENDFQKFIANSQNKISGGCFDEYVQRFSEKAKAVKPFALAMNVTPKANKMEANFLIISCPLPRPCIPRRRLFQAIRCWCPRRPARKSR